MEKKKSGILGGRLSFSKKRDDSTAGLSPAQKKEAMDLVKTRGISVEEAMKEILERDRTPTGDRRGTASKNVDVNALLALASDIEKTRSVKKPAAVDDIGVAPMPGAVVYHEEEESAAAAEGRPKPARPAPPPPTGAKNPFAADPTSPNKSATGSAAGSASTTPRRVSNPFGDPTMRASDLKLSNNDLLAVMLRVKEGNISVDDAVAEVLAKDKANKEANPTAQAPSTAAGEQQQAPQDQQQQDDGAGAGRPTFMRTLSSSLGNMKNRVSVLIKKGPREDGITEDPAAPSNPFATPSSPVAASSPPSAVASPKAAVPAPSFGGAVVPEAVVGRARVLTTCEPTYYDWALLRVEKGEIINVLNVDPDDSTMWKCQKGGENGEVGLVKFVYLEMLPVDQTAPESTEATTAAADTPSADGSASDAPSTSFVAQTLFPSHADSEPQVLAVAAEAATEHVLPTSEDAAPAVVEEVVAEVVAEIAAEVAAEPTEEPRIVPTETADVQDSAPVAAVESTHQVAEDPVPEAAPAPVPAPRRAPVETAQAPEPAPTHVEVPAPAAVVAATAEDTQEEEEEEMTEEDAMLLLKIKEAEAKLLAAQLGDEAEEEEEEEEEDEELSEEDRMLMEQIQAAEAKLLAAQTALSD